MAQVTCRRLTSWWQMPQWLIWLFLWLATVALLAIISCLLGAIETSSIFMLLCFLGGWYFHWVLILSSLNLRLMIFFSCFPKCLYTTFENDLNSLFFPRLLLDTEGWWEGDWFDRGTMGRPDLKVEFSLSNLQQPVQKAQLYTFWQLASDGQDLISVGAVAPIFTLTSNQGPDWEGKPCPPAQPVGPSHCWQWPQLLCAHCESLYSFTCLSCWPDSRDGDCI